MCRVVRRNYGDGRRKGVEVRGEEGDVRRQMYFAKQMSNLKSRKRVCIHVCMSIFHIHKNILPYIIKQTVIIYS